jgi:hypothetical protein
MKKLTSVIYCAAFFAICLVPSFGMAVTDPSESSENRTLAEFPSLSDEDGINIDWLSEAGDYFQEHFAFRNELVTANAIVNGKVLGVSTASGVICGTDGWLYYKDSLDDYLGTELMSDRSLFNLAHSLAMVQKNLTRRGVSFLFTVAPNKNTLYGENMPYYDSLKVSEEKNLTRLKTYLEQEGVAYADLYEVLSAEDEVLYHQRDSHWNNKGAALAADTLLAALGQEHTSYEDAVYEVRTDYEGDLDQMLYPLAMEPEDEIYYDTATTFAYVGEVSSNFDPKITTVNPVKTGSLVMYRDSFGNALLPFLADAYANAYFTRGLPYQISEVDTAAADTVIIECAERFLPERAATPPKMEANSVLWDGELVYDLNPAVAVADGDAKNTEDVDSDSDVDQTAAAASDSDAEQSAAAVPDLEMSTIGVTTQITGRIQNDLLETDTRIYIRINGLDIYEAFPMDVVTDEGTDSGGFCLYLSSNQVITGQNLIEVMVRDGETLTIISQDSVTDTSEIAG